MLLGWLKVSLLFNLAHADWFFNQQAGNLSASEKIKEKMGPEPMAPNTVNSTLAHIRQYQKNPTNDFKDWPKIMEQFHPDLSLTFEVDSGFEGQSFTVNITRTNPIFRAAWVLTEGSNHYGFKVMMTDPDGDLVYRAHNEQEGIIALEITKFGLYTLELVNRARYSSTVTLMTASSSVDSLGVMTGDPKQDQDVAFRFHRIASDIKRSMRFFQRRRAAHNEKLSKILSSIRNYCAAVLICGVVVALLQVASIKHLVRKRLRTMIY